MPPIGLAAMMTGDDQLRWEREQAVISLPVEIDVTNAGDVRQTLRAAASHGSSVLVIDMSATTFCDSAGLQAIIDTHNQIQVLNQSAVTPTQLRLVAPAVRRIMQLVGVDQLIPVYASVEEALGELG